MMYEVNQLVEHPKFGLGKIVKIEGDRVEVFFKDQATNPIPIRTSVFPLQVAVAQTDLWFDSFDPAASERAKKGKYVTQKAAIAKFVRLFPLGFYDPEYAEGEGNERSYKWAAHELWCRTLSKPEYERLLTAEAFQEIVERALRVEGKTNLLASFEKAALRDALRTPADQKLFAAGLSDLIYGSDSYELRFNRFVAVLDQLPQPKTELRWTIVTLFPFLAMPNEHMFLKPVVTKEAAERLGFRLSYEVQPNWLTYSRLLQFAERLKTDLAEFRPRDMIDIQSFIWVTGDGSYT